MSFKIKIKIELTLNHSTLEEELGKDYSFEEGKAFIEEAFNNTFPKDDPLNAHIESLEIIRIEEAIDA